MVVLCGGGVFVWRLESFLEEFGGQEGGLVLVVHGARRCFNGGGDTTGGGDRLRCESKMENFSTDIKICQREVRKLSHCSFPMVLIYRAPLLLTPPHLHM
ncbi:hypothetical protein LR48_Vigan01g149600 [Vigna angularis]|uniref:Uncharacterized protein n=1 Tax=Phaseolus angularis TaxID=3914 RepID=A0A0L9TN28_PHAAN|nr:hypothetical protein LR48_Vigan01g149600 [Vigna angularis]